MNGYVAFYNKKRIELYADTLYAAKQIAVKMFKVSRAKEHMVSVVLAEENGEEVTHLPLD